MLALGLVAGGTAAGVEALEAAYAAGATAAQRVQLVQDEQLVRAARIGCAADAGEAECATEAQLVARGWLLPEFAWRERVVVEPVQLANQIEEAGQ